MRNTNGSVRFVAMGLALFLHCATVPSSSGAESKFKIITSTTDLAALAQEIGGDKVEVESVARGYQDPHFVEAKPSFLLKLRKADLLIVVGLELRRFSLREDPGNSDGRVDAGRRRRPSPGQPALLA